MRDKQKILRTAEKYVLDQKFSAAIREYEKLLELEPDEPTLLNIVGDLLVRQGKPQEALKNFQRVVEIFLKSWLRPQGDRHAQEDSVDCSPGYASQRKPGRPLQ